MPESCQGDTIPATVPLQPTPLLLGTLQPELALFQLWSENGNVMAMAGIVDAIAFGKDGSPEVVIDWKSNVAPAAETR